MAEKVPLLPQFNSPPLSTPDEAPAASFDDVLEGYIGGNGFSQILQTIIISFAWCFDAQQTFISIFTDAEPAWHHITSPAAAPGGDSSSFLSDPSPCGVPRGSWDWDLPKQAFVVSEWDLQCSGPVIVGLPASAYFFGCLVGGFLLATLADSILGRRKMLCLSCFTMSITGVMTVVSPNLWAYSALRFLCGCARATICTSALVLSTELVGKRVRDKVSIVGFFCFTLGFLSLPAMAYVNRGSSWRNLYLWASLPCFLYSISIYFFIQESPRWLLVRGRRDEAIETLRRMVPPSAVIDPSFSKLETVADTPTLDVLYAIKALLEKKWAFRRLAALMVVGIGVGMVYYGMPLNLGNLGQNLYSSVALNALAELPSSLITLLLIGRMDRRSSSLFFTTASGILCVACLFLQEGGWRTAAEVASFFSACTAFNVLMIYCLELFPTCVRNSALSFLRQAIVLGGVIAPVLVAEGRRRSYVSFGVFGVVIGGCGMFTATLPESRGKSMCDTMEEQENKERLLSSSDTIHHEVDQEANAVRSKSTL